MLNLCENMLAKNLCRALGEAPLATSADIASALHRLTPLMNQLLAQQPQRETEARLLRGLHQMVSILVIQVHQHNPALVLLEWRSWILPEDKELLTEIVPDDALAMAELESRLRAVEAREYELAHMTPLEKLEEEYDRQRAQELEEEVERSLLAESEQGQLV